MKISKIFHFLYFSVLSIPLISMPIFAIYSQNHEITGYEVTINESYWENSIKYETNEVNTYDDLQLNHIYYAEYLTLSDDSYYSIYIYSGNLLDITIDYFDETVINSYDSSRNNYIYVSYTANDEMLLNITNGNAYQSIIIQDAYIEFGNCNFVIVDNLEGFKLVCTANDIDVTSSDFKVVESIYHENEPITYNDTDIMSQFIYNEYNFMDKYLGIYKFSPFNDIYQWLQNTFFVGAAPMVFTIFYQWFAYWLFVSLCWLIFDVLMFVPLVAHRWLDKASLQ